MGYLMRILILIFMFSNILFASDFEVNFGFSFGYSIEFTYIKGDTPLWLGYQDGNRVDNGATVNTIISNRKKL